MAQHAWTLDRLKEKTASERYQLYQNATQLGGPVAEELLKLLDEAGLPVSDDPSLRRNDPTAEKVAEIAYSKEARDRMTEAIEAGQPPMAGLDPLLARELGADYGRHNMSAAFAGRIAAERMTQLGYRKTGKKAALPTGCVARTAEVMLPPDSDLDEDA